MEKPIRLPEKQNHTRVHGSTPHKKDNNLRPQPNGDHGLLSSKWPTIGRFDSPKFWGSNVELRRSQLLNTVHPPLYSKWNLSKNQTQTLGNPIQDAYGKSRSLIFVKKYGTWIDPFPGLLVTTRWLADIFRLQMAPGIPNYGRGSPAISQQDIPRYQLLVIKIKEAFCRGKIS